MPAISVGSVEVDVIPNAAGILGRLQAALVPPATQVGDEIGRIIGQRLAAHIAPAVRNGITNGARTATPAAVRGGQQTGSTFARSFKARIEAALADLPDVRLRADSSDAEREIYQIRAQLTALRDVRIGIDVSSADANAVIGRLQERLARLSASDANVAIRVDAGAAAAQLAAFQAEVNRLDGQHVDVDVDTKSAAANFNLLTTAAIAFGPAIIPVLPVVAAGLGAIAAAGVAAAAGIGSIALVAIPAFKGIATTLQAQKAAQDAATNATVQGGQAASQGASRALQMAGAQQALATAERNGARQIAQAQAAVRQARQAAADAAAQASQRNAQAARQVQDAERSLADAQRDARRAQDDLTAARRTAGEELEDLNNRLSDSALSQRDAEIALTEAAAQRDTVLNNANATELERQKAILAYDQAVQRLKEQTTETKRLKGETAAANKAGVDGSETVRSAQERVADAQRTVADQARAVKDAQVEAARTQVETARQVADAQQRVSEATENVAVAQQNAADSVASAQRQIESSSISAAGGVDQAAIAQAKYRAELAKLTPSARETFDAFVDLRSAFGAWSKSLQPAVMPIFTRALIGLKNSLPGLTPFVLAAASAIGDLQDRASAGFTSPWWREFKTDLLGSVQPAITGLGVSFGRIFKGMVGVIDAFLPHMDGISSRLQGMTQRFANWGQGLKGSPEFERFLAYSAEHGPLLATTFGKIATAVLDIGQALAPVSGPLLTVVGYLAQGLSSIATYLPELVLGMYGLWVATRLWAVAQLILNGALLAFNLISKAGPWGWIILGIAAVVLAVIYMYRRFEWMRTGVRLLWTGLRTLGGWLKWLWDKTVAVVKGIIRGFQWLYDVLIGHSILPDIIAFIRGPFAAVFRWIRDHVIRPVMSGIRSAISVAWEKGIKPVFDALKSTVGRVADAFEDARKAIKTAWDKLKSIAKAPVAFVINTVYNGGIVAVWNKIAGAFGAPRLNEFHPKGFASGGIMPGYTPGRDVHRFVSPTGGALELSGGEAIMRPEFTRAVGSGFVGAMNSIAKSRGAQGVKAALAPVFGGNPKTPTDTSLRYAQGGITQRFADGGIFGWIGDAASKVAGAGSAAWNTIKKGASWLADTLEASARAGVKHVVDPLLKRFPGMDTGIGRMVRHIPDKILNALFGYSKKADDKGAGGVGGPRIQAALKWARTQNGKPYQWGGNGNPSWDCSGFMSAIESVIRGQKPHRRWSTHSFSGKTAPPGWVYHGNSPFKVGITAAGVGHTAGTLGKTKVESRGGDGVIVGKRARGYNSGLFNSWYGFKPGSYDSGGYLQPGMNLAYNGTGRPEPVFTTGQARALQTMAAGGPASGPASFEGSLYLDSGEWLGRVRGEAAAVMQEGQQRLISVLRSS